MKTLRFLAIAFGVCALASAQNINVQKASTTNNITGNLTIGSGKTLLGDTGSITNFSMVGIGTGTTTAATNLQVVDTATTTPRGITNDQYNNGTNGAQMNWRKARGTFATPLTAVTGDLLGRAIFWGYDGTSYIESGNLRFTSLGTIGTNRMPSVFDVYVSTDAAPSVLTQTASFSGTAGITLTAIGTNQGITLTPSGTGVVQSSGSIYSTKVASNGVAAFEARSTGPRIQWNKTDGSVNAKFWDFEAATSNEFHGRVINDADSASTNWLSVVRSGTTVSGITFGGPVLLNGLTAIGVGAMQLPAATTSAGGITFGADFNFYRFGALSAAFDSAGSTVFQVRSSGVSGLELLANGSNGFITAIGSLILRSNSGTTAQTLDASQNTTFAGRAIGASFGTASAAAVAVRYNSTSSITVNNATSTGLQFNNYGAGALSTDASGNITATSDGRLKNVVGAFARGLTSIRNLHPATYRWKKESGMDTEHDYTGFVAQDVQAAIPEAIGKTPDGFLTFNDRPVLAAAVNAINELDGKTVSKTEIRIFEFIALAALVLAIRANVRKN